MNLAEKFTTSHMHTSYLWQNTVGKSPSASEEPESGRDWNRRNRRTRWVNLGIEVKERNPSVFSVFPHNFPSILLHFICSNSLVSLFIIIGFTPHAHDFFFWLQFHASLKKYFEASTFTTTLVPLVSYLAICIFERERIKVYERELTSGLSVCFICAFLFHHSSHTSHILI